MSYLGNMCQKVLNVYFCDGDLDHVLVTLILELDLDIDLDLLNDLDLIVDTYELYEGNICKKLVNLNFLDRDLDLDLMTLVLYLDLDIVTLFKYSKFKLPTTNGSKVRAQNVKFNILIW